MAFSRVQNAVSTPSASPYTATLTPTTGNCLIICITTSNNVTPNTPTDTQGNTFVSLGGPSGNATSGFVSAWLIASAKASTSNTVSITFGSAPGGGEMIIAEYNPGAGVTVSSETSGFNAATGSNNAPLTSNYSSSVTNDLMVCYVGMASTPTTTAGSTGTPGNWSKLPAPSPPDTFTGVEDSLSNSISATNTGTWSLGSSASWTVMAFAVKAVASGATGTSVVVRHPF